MGRAQRAELKAYDRQNLNRASSSPGRPPALTPACAALCRAAATATSSKELLTLADTHWGNPIAMALVTSEGRGKEGVVEEREEGENHTGTGTGVHNSGE